MVILKTILEARVSTSSLHSADVLHYELEPKFGTVAALSESLTPKSICKE